MNSPDTPSTHSNSRAWNRSLESEHIRKRLEFTQFTSEHAGILKELKGLITKHADYIVDGFYKNIEKYPELMRIVDGAGSNIDRLKGAQKTYLLELFDGTYDAAYFEKRLKIGAVHCRIGLGPKWYLGSYAVYYALIAPLVSSKYRFHPARTVQALAAINKILAIDSQLAIETYIDSMITSASATINSVQESVSQQAAASAQQAAAIHETTTSLEEIKVTSTQTLEMAIMLGDNAGRTQTEGEAGSKAMADGMVAMQEISERVESIATTIITLSEQIQQIGEITSVVNNLAQQSKMLALNAAIEASKAGDVGKGFGVVAMEVRNLAEQSEEATTQVKDILGEIQNATDKAVMATEEGSKKVEEGGKLIETAGQAMTNLQAAIDDAVTASQQIGAAVRQEAAGIEQVTAAMADIDAVTNQFVDSAETIRTSYGELRIEIDRLGGGE